MTRRSDQVFQVSLTEIAFTIAFLLLLLLGYVVFSETQKRRAAEAAVANDKEMEALVASFDQARREIERAMKEADVATPDQVISALVDASKAKSERDELKRRVEQLDAKLTALESIRERLGEIGKGIDPKLTTREVEEAIVTAQQVRDAMKAVQESTPKKHAEKQAENRDKAPTGEDVRSYITTGAEFQKAASSQLGLTVKKGDERKSVETVVGVAKTAYEQQAGERSFEQLAKENKDLKGQLEFVRRKLARGGRDYPPCWADAEGRVQYLLDIELRRDAIAVKPAWVPEREADARALPNIDVMLEKTPHSYRDFRGHAHPLLQWSNQKECRHYVYLRSTIPGAAESDRARLLVEDYFYKFERSR